MENNMQDKTIIITGAAKGIGRGLALKFAEQKANLVLNYRSNIDEELIKEITDLGANVKTIKADVSNFEEASEVVNFAKNEFKTIDCLINNAGITKDNLIIGMKEDDFDSVINVNLKGVFNMCKHTSKIMLKQKSGNIINMSSVIGLNGNMGQTNYAASKAGIIGLTKSLAKELGSRNIRVNAIAPGFIETDMTEVLSDDIKNSIKKSIVLNRLGNVNHIADTALFLLNNDYITGQCIVVDGCLMM